jgi:hypothetical protein
MLAITYSMKKEIKVAKWGTTTTTTTTTTTPKKIFKKNCCRDIRDGTKTVNKMKILHNMLK